MYRGRVIAQGNPQEIRSMVTGQLVLEIEVAEPDSALDLILSVPGVRDAYLSGSTVHAVIDTPGVGPSDIPERLRSVGLGEARVSTVEPTIEDAFVALVSGYAGTTSPTGGASSVPRT